MCKVVGICYFLEDFSSCFSVTGSGQKTIVHHWTRKNWNHFTTPTFSL